jgi:hypothetical protein
MAVYADQCKGWPRNKNNPGNWIDESSNYIWNIGAQSWNGGSYHPPDTHACPVSHTYQTIKKAPNSDKNKTAKPAHSHLP